MVAANARKYGDLWLEKGQWHMRTEPHVVMMAKRVFAKIPPAGGIIRLPNDAETCRLLRWFIDLYPLRCPDEVYLQRQSDSHVMKLLRLHEIIDQKYEPREFQLDVPPRQYQRVAAELYLQTKGLLLADDLGLGKTCTSICSLTEKATLPALIVCPANLTFQWQDELAYFIPSLQSHILRTRRAYELPLIDGRGPDVIISSYAKMASWSDSLAGYVKSIILDEVQELRHPDSQKYAACQSVADRCDFRLGLSATPIYNYGGEIFNVMEVLKPGSLGTRGEFCAEYCDGFGEKASLTDPVAFGSFLREQGLMIRRTRRDVKRELKPVTRQTVRIDCDSAALNQVSGAAGELARIILSDSMSGLEKMNACGQLDAILRQATGIAKAPHVAEFVKTLLDSGESVVLWGWHRAVYDIWMEKLKVYAPALYTGSESPAAKHRELQRFIDGQTKLLIMSLRSGAGVDGIQHCCRTGVFGELDWSPAIHEQCGGRLARDGQPDPVGLYFLTTDDGADPMISEILGLKRQQSDGLIGKERDALVQVDHSEGIRRLAEKYLRRGGIPELMRGATE